MGKKQEINRQTKRKVVIIIVVSVLLVFLLFPRKHELKDGGTIMYCSIAFGAIYQVEQRHCFYEEVGTVYYEVGTVVTIFGLEVFNNAHVDYEHGYPLKHSPEAEVINKDIDRVLTISIEN